MATFCEYCDGFANTHIEKYTETIKVKDVPITITARGSFCNECHHQLFDRDLDNEALLTAYREYRNEKNLLQPEEIKQIRTKYGLTQVAFAKLLGFGEKTIARYEGGSLQDEAPNSLIYLMGKPTNMLEMLNKYGKSRLNEDELRLAVKNAKDLVFLKISTYKPTFDSRIMDQVTYKAMSGNQAENQTEYSIDPSALNKNTEWRSVS